MTGEPRSGFQLKPPRPDPSHLSPFHEDCGIQVSTVRLRCRTPNEVPLKPKKYPSLEFPIPHIWTFPATPAPKTGVNRAVTPCPGRYFAMRRELKMAEPAAFV